MSIYCHRLAITAILGLALQFTAAAEVQPEKWLESHAVNLNAGRMMEDSKMMWFDAAGLSIEGKAFVDSLTSYSRLSVRHKAAVTKDVWQNGLSASGVTVRFVTDSPTIAASWDSAAPAMNHMAWSGSAGLDLYALETGKWVFRGVGRPTTTTLNTVTLQAEAAGHQKQPTEYLLFLPSYSKLEKLEIGVVEGSRVSPADNRYNEKKPVVFYGTSITQGGCASRSGMGHPAILRRWLDYPIINLGFSGSGKCEPAMADVLAEIPASLYIIETVSNMTAEMINERVVKFVKQLRSKAPETPILLVESPNISTGVAPNAAYKAAYDSLKVSGIDNIRYLAGDGLYNGRENPTVDNSHPTDLGFYEMATAYEPVIRELLGLK